MGALEREQTDSQALPRSREWIARGEAASTLTTVVTLLGLGSIVAAAYLLTRAPLYNPFETIDPWLYTALWANFHQIYPAFVSTYYASRVPWIAPGFALVSLFSLRSAFWVVHASLFFGGGLLLFFVARRRLGLAGAAVAYVVLLGSQMYYDAHRWDYEEGGVIFLIIATIACASWTPASEPLRRVAAFLTGFCAAALAGTRVLDVIYLLGGAALYWAAKGPLPRTGWLDRLRKDIPSAAAGVVVLIGLCGWFSKTYGGPFLFFLPQWRVLSSGSGEGNHVPMHLWLPSMPSAFVPFGVLAAGVIAVIVSRRRGLPAVVRRFQIAATIWLGVSLAIVTAWEATGQGFVFELVYYFSSLLPPIAFCVAAVVPAVVWPLEARRAAIVLAVSTAATLGPLLWLYRTDDPARFPTHYGSSPYLAVLVALGAAVALAGIAGLTRRLTIGLVAVAVLVFATSYGVDASSGTYVDGRSDPHTGQLYSLGEDLVGYLSSHGFDGAGNLPHFWYDGSAAATAPGAPSPGFAFTSLQSLYYYSYTYVGVAMPVIDADFKLRMHLYRPKRLVLLCQTAACDDGPAALRRAGYRPLLEARSRLAAGPLAYWVAIYRLRNPPR